MSNPTDSPPVIVVDAALPVQDFSLLETPTQAQRPNLLPAVSPYKIGHNAIMDPDHYVFKLKFEDSEAFLETVISHLTRFLDLPGAELEILRNAAKNEMKSCTNKMPKKSWGFMKKKEIKGVIFGTNLTEESLVQIQNLTDFLASHLEVEGLFRKPGNAHRLLQLRAALNTGVCIDLESSKFHSHDVASILKTYLGELPEPLLQHKYFKSHLQIAEMMAFDAKGNRTTLPDRAKRVEALQLLMLLLPTVNRTLLRGILNLLYQTAKNQKMNKMNASNLATMFCPHLLWPRNLKTTDLQNNIGKLNDHVAFMIRHSQKIFAAPQYIRDSARTKYTGSTSKQDYPSVIFTQSGAVKRTSSGRNEYAMETRSYTDQALKELFEQVQNMPNSAKKKKIVKNMEKQGMTPGKKRHKRSRTFGGMIKKKVLSVATPNNNKMDSDGANKDKQETFVHIPQPGSGTLLRSRPVLSRRKSASSKKADNRASMKDSFFRRSLKVDRKGSRSSEIGEAEQSDSTVMSPIPFPSLEDGTDKENEKKIESDSGCQKCI
ncbi:rho GTPase-activating protein 19-like [Styela clava]